jgi:hypothetical protein
MTASGQGYEADFLSTIVGDPRAERAVAFVPQRFSRHWYVYDADERFDGATTIPDFLSLPGYRTEPYARFFNGIGYLPETFPDGLCDGPLDGLAGHRVVAFAGASNILPGLAERIASFESYEETQNQLLQSEMLAAGTADAVIADRMIFFSYNALTEVPEALAAARFIPAFPPAEYALVFRDAVIRDRVNDALANLNWDGPASRQVFPGDPVPDALASAARTDWCDHDLR